MLLLFFFLIPSYCDGYFFLSHSCVCLFKVLQFKFLVPVLCEIVLQNVLILTAFINNKKELLIHYIYLLIFVIIIVCCVNTSKLRTMLKIIANTFSAYMSVLASVQKPENTSLANITRLTSSVAQIVWSNTERATLDSKKSKDQRMGLINLMRLRRHKIFVRFLWFIKKKQESELEINNSWSTDIV